MFVVIFEATWDDPLRRWADPLPLQALHGQRALLAPPRLVCRCGGIIWIMSSADDCTNTFEHLWTLWSTCVIVSCTIDIGMILDTVLWTHFLRKNLWVKDPKHGWQRWWLKPQARRKTWCRANEPWMNLAGGVSISDGSNRFRNHLDWEEAWRLKELVMW